MPVRVIFAEKSDPTESVDGLSHSEINRVVPYMRIDMLDLVAAQKERAEGKSPHWLDNRELVTGKFEKDESVARVLEYLADQCDGPIGTDPPTWGFSRGGDKVHEFQPVAQGF